MAIRRAIVDILLVHPDHRLSAADLEARLRKAGVSYGLWSMWDFLGWLRIEGRLDYDRGSGGSAKASGSVWQQRADGTPVSAK